MATTNNAENIDICTQRIGCINEHVPAKTTIGVEGVVMKVADRVKTYQTALDARTEAVSAQAQLTGARRQAEDG